MPVATQMPCSEDDVVIPAGYSTRMVAYGRQLRGRFGSYTSSGDLIWAETKAELPVHFHTPSGASLDMLLSGDTDNEEPAPLVRECHSTCLAQDDINPLAYINMPGETAARIRAQTRADAQAALGAGRRPVEGDFVFSYHGLAGRLDVSEGCTSRLPIATVMASNVHIPPETSVTNVGITASADNGGTITVTGRYSSTVGRLDGLEQELEGSPFDVTNRPGTLAGLLYYPVFHSVIEATGQFEQPSTTCVVFEEESALWLSAGLNQSQTLTIYTGSNLPQADIPNLVNRENVASYSTALFNGLDGSYGMVGLDQNSIESSLYQSSVLTSPRLIMTDRGGRDRRNEQINYGRASTLVRVTLRFAAYGEVTWDSPVGRAIEARADMITGIFPFSPPEATQCWDYVRGYNVSCIRTAVNDDILTVMTTSQECAKDLTGTECTALATASGRAVWDRLVGCGAMGVNRAGICTDPKFRSDGVCPAAEVTMFTNMTCDAVEETARAQGSTGDDDAGMGLLSVVIIVAAAFVVCIILVAALIVKSTAKNGGGGRAQQKQYEGTGGTASARMAPQAFENPMYGGGNGNNSIIDDDDDIDAKFNKLRTSVDGGLYDDPQEYSQGTGGSVSKANPTYSSNENLAASDDLYDNTTAGDMDDDANAGGGYLDVVPADGEDDSDDEEEDEDYNDDNNEDPAQQSNDGDEDEDE